MSSSALTFWKQRVFQQMDLSPCNGCDGCGLRCTAGVPLSQEEREAVQQYIEAAPDRQEIARVLRQDKAVDLGDGVIIQMCRYRDMERGRCAIYPARPLVCRLMGHVEWMPCPIEHVPRVAPTEDALALMRTYARSERRTFEDWEAAEEAP